jgi:methyl-accepting chemotaxis protein
MFTVRHFRDLSIRHKLPLMLIGVVTVVLFASSVAVSVSDVSNSRRQMKKRYSALAKVTAVNSAAVLSIADLDPVGAEEFLSGLEVEPAIAFAALYDTSGVEAARYEAEGFGAFQGDAPQSLEPAFTDDGFLDVVQEVPFQEQVIGRIYLRVATDQLDVQIQRHVYIALIVFLVALCTVVVLSLFLQRIISTPILGLAKATQRVSSEHDYSVRVEKIGDDELGLLSDGFNSMLEQIEQKESQLAHSNAELETTVRDMASTLEQLQQRETQLEQANAEREKTILGIREAVGQLSSMGTELLATIAQQTAGAHQQAQAVSQTVSTMAQVATSSSEAAETARNVGDAARRTSEAGVAGRKAVEECVQAMREVNEQGQVTADSTLALADRAQAIGEIIETVKTIAGQINLLALNAAIEASRAGEYGRGFAVVASDVKQLAAQSQKATQKIRHILGEIREATNKTVLSTEHGNKAVKQATVVVVQAGSTIDTLAQALDESSRAAAQIVTSSRQQAEGINDVAKAMNNIDNATQQAITAARQVEETAQNLTALSSKLAELI